jgi:chaperonin GroEL (HSP60 family)
LTKPLILVVAGEIKSQIDILQPLEFIKSINRPIIIFSQKMHKEPLSLLVYNKTKGGINVNKYII